MPYLNLKRDCLVNIRDLQRSSVSIHTHTHAPDPMKGHFSLLLCLLTPLHSWLLDKHKHIHAHTHTHTQTQSHVRTLLSPPLPSNSTSRPNPRQAHTHTHMWSHVRTLLSPPLPPDSTSRPNSRQAQTISGASWSSPTWLFYTSHIGCHWSTWTWESLTDLLFVYPEYLLKGGRTTVKEWRGIKGAQGI